MPNIGGDLEEINDGGVVNIHLVGLASQGKTKAFFLPPGARVLELDPKIAPNSTTSFKFQKPVDQNAHGPADNWLNKKNASGDITVDLAEDEPNDLSDAAYAGITAGWYRFGYSTSVNTRVYLVLRVWIPYAWRRGPNDLYTYEDWGF